jgi:hypothetical protein
MKSVFCLITVGLASFFTLTDVKAQPTFIPFASPASAQSINNTSNFTRFQVSAVNNKTLLQWEVAKNETVDQFMVEKSSDGKNFSVAALVFGSDKSQTELYMYYEKTGSKKIFYRIKCIDNQQKSMYSPVVEFDPSDNMDNASSL